MYASPFQMVSNKALKVSKSLADSNFWDISASCRICAILVYNHGLEIPLLHIMNTSCTCFVSHKIGLDSLATAIKLGMLSVCNG